MEITKEWLIEKGACSDSIKAFKNQKETNSFKILDTLVKDESEKRLNWANWLLVRLMTKKQCIQYAVFAARKALPVFEEEYPNDDRPRKAIEAVERYLEDPSEERRQEAEIAGGVACAAARAARDAARAAAYAAYAARAAAWAAYAARAAAWAARATVVYAEDATYNAGKATDEKTFKEIINFGIKLLKEETNN